MNKIRLSYLIAAAILLATSLGAHAQRGGGAKASGDFGGRSDMHLSGQGLLNSNGPNAADRDKGRSRAEDRAEMHASDRPGKAHLQHGKH
uniref:hypothetical protein n=1 Tax=Cupriavidus yeoncheonensis TaxID=1462994 RepID=UPI003F497F90